MGADEPARAQKSKRGVNVSIVWPSSLLDEVHLLRHDSEYFCEVVLLWVKASSWHKPSQAVVESPLILSALQVRTLERHANASVGAFAASWLRMAESRPHIAFLADVIDAAWTAVQVHGWARINQKGCHK